MAAPSPSASFELGAMVTVVPAFEEAGSIGTVVREARAALPGSRVLVVDDGSTDATASIAEAAGAIVLRRPRNGGKGAALRQGMTWALAQGAQLVLTLDGDGQHRAGDLPALLRAATAAPGSIVIGSRRGQHGQPWLRYAANRLADALVGLAAGQRIADSQCGMRAYPAAALAGLGRYRDRSNGFEFDSELLIDLCRAGHAVVAVPIAPRYAGLTRSSHFRPIADAARIGVMVLRKLLRLS